MLHSGLKKRHQRDQLNKFKDGSEDAIIVAAKMIDEGFDAPDAKIGIIASFSNSKRQWIQRKGRIRRYVKGKESHLFPILVEGIDEKNSPYDEEEIEKFNQMQNHEIDPSKLKKKEEGSKNIQDINSEEEILYNQLESFRIWCKLYSNGKKFMSLKKVLKEYLGAGGESFIEFAHICKKRNIIPTITQKKLESFINQNYGKKQVIQDQYQEGPISFASQAS